MSPMKVEIIRGFDCLSYLLRKGVFTNEEYPTILAAKNILEQRLVEFALSSDERQTDIFGE